MRIATNDNCKTRCLDLLSKYLRRVVLCHIFVMRTINTYNMSVNFEFLVYHEFERRSMLLRNDGPDLAQSATHSGF